MKHKFQLFLIVFISNICLIHSDPTFINSYPYQGDWPDHWYYTYDTGVCNVIPAIGGGFLIEAFVNPGYEFEEEPQSIFIKVSDDGELEWWKQDFSIFGLTYIRSIVSNGIDRYYAISGPGGHLSLSGRLFILDEFCNVVSEYNYWEEDSLRIKINSMEILDDGLIMAGYIDQGVPLSGIYIMKTDFNGEIIWRKDDGDYDLNNRVSHLNSVCVLPDSDFLFCGYRSMQPTKAKIYKTDSIGDTLWTTFQDSIFYSSLLAYDEYTFYALGYISDFYPGHGVLTKFNEDGEILNEYNILTSLSDQEKISRMIKTNDDNILIMYNSQEGEIHKISPDGELIWSRNYLTDSGYIDYIAINDKKGFQLPNNDYVYGGTIDRQQLYPELVLLRVDEEGFVSSSDYQIPPADHNLFNYPNPFNPSTTVTFLIKTDAEIELAIYNLRGQRVKTLVRNHYAKGSHSINWDGTNIDNCSVSSGIYLIKLIIDNSTVITSKGLLIK